MYLYIHSSRSQWPRGMRQELSSLVRTLASWVQVPHKAWMSLCAFIILCLCRPVCVGSGLAFGKIWCNIADHVVPSFYTLLESDERSLHVLTHRPTASDGRFLRAGKNSRLRMNVPSTSLPKGASRASLVYAGKNKVRYFLNTPRILI
jgi:hypothetical protein